MTETELFFDETKTIEYKTIEYYRIKDYQK